LLFADTSIGPRDPVVKTQFDVGRAFEVAKTMPGGKDGEVYTLSKFD
jgi:hypothetical protein